MRIFDGLVQLISHSKFYINYVSQWPAPFNIVSFDALLLLILLIVIIRAVWDGINSYHYAVKFRAKQQKLQEERVEQEIKQRERDRQREEDNDIIRQYLKFLSMASAQNVLGTNPVSLEEFKAAVKADKQEKEEYIAEESKVYETADQAEDDIKEQPVFYKEEEKAEEKYDLNDIFNDISGKKDKDDEVKAVNKADSVSAEAEGAQDDIFERKNEASDDDVFAKLEENDVFSKENDSDADTDDKEEEKSIFDILVDNGIDPKIQEEIEDEDPMSESDFSRIMNSLAKNEAAKNEAKAKEDRKRKQIEEKEKMLDEKVKESIDSQTKKKSDKMAAFRKGTQVQG